MAPESRPAQDECPIAVMRFLVETSDEGSLPLHDEAAQRWAELEREVRATFSRTTEGRLRIGEIHLYKGSVEVVVFVYAVYGALRSAKEVAETLEWAYRGIRGLLARFFSPRGRGRIQVTGGWTYVPSSAPAAPRRGAVHREPWLLYLVVHDVVMTLALLALVFLRG